MVSESIKTTVTNESITQLGRFYQCLFSVASSASVFYNLVLEYEVGIREILNIFEDFGLAEEAALKG